MFLSLAGALVILAATPGPVKAKVVVLQPRSFDTSTDKRAEELAEVTLTELANTGRLEVLGQSDLQAVLGLERQKALLGCEESSSTAGRRPNLWPCRRCSSPAEPSIRRAPHPSRTHLSLG